MTTRPDPVQPADAEALTLARDLLQSARHAALAVIDPETGTPGISRIAFGLDPQGCPLTLVSALAPHRAALAAHPAAAVMVGEVGDNPRRALKIMEEYTSDGRLHMAYSFDLLGPKFSQSHFRSRVTRL